MNATAQSAVGVPEQSDNAERSIKGLLQRTVREWLDDKASRLAAAMAYYMIFALPPLIVVAISIAGLVFGADAAQSQMTAQLSDLMGEAGADTISDMVLAAQKPSRGLLATSLGIVLLSLGAAGVFGQLQDALNTIWEVEPKPGRGFFGVIKDRFLSFAMVLGTGFLFLVSLLLTAAVSAIGKWFDGILPGPEILMHVLTFAATFIVTTILFAMIFKLVPDAKTAWRDVWIGAALTALLFNIGKFALGLYFGHSSAASSFGVASSVILILMWVYYSAQILFLGAEFTQVYAQLYGSSILPAADAQAAPSAKREPASVAASRPLPR